MSVDKKDLDNIKTYLNDTNAQEKLATLNSGSIGRIFDDKFTINIDVEKFYPSILKAFKNNQLESFLVEHFLKPYGKLVLDETLTDLNQIVKDAILKARPRMPLPSINTPEIKEYFLDALISCLSQQLCDFVEKSNSFSKEECFELITILGQVRYLNKQSLNTPPLNQTWIKIDIIEKQMNKMDLFLESLKRHPTDASIQSKIQNQINSMKADKREIENQNASPSFKQYFLLNTLRSIQTNLRSIKVNPPAQEIKTFLLNQKQQLARDFLESGGNKEVGQKIQTTNMG